MLPWIMNRLGDAYPELADKLRLFDYISSRSAAALGLAFLLSLIFGPRVIRWLGMLGIGQQVRKTQGQGAVDLYAMHGAKHGTPTMGGLLIAGTLLASVFVFADWRNPYVVASLVVIVGFGLIGFVDDYLKVTKRNHHGLSARLKMAGQILIGFFLAVFMMKANLGIYYAPTETSGSTHLTVPFVKSVYPNLSLLFIPFAILVVVAASNAVNLTDGLDGLAGGCAMICTLAFTLVTYLAHRRLYADYLLIPYVPYGSELTVVLCALMGAILGFLWFNAHPAIVFMGDIGSLTIGGLLGAVAIMIRQEILLAIIGGIFVLEALSVIIQVGSYKLRKKRVFLMSPIHHHFEKLGWPETRIVARFYIVAALLAMVGLMTLKLR
ncbi:MAG: Phospho-N-acetylmuramoyl-pentapeptide-transferase [candidate division BRC1 bacterium ADurb.BinA364]|nr:MAG: Phospho-N-acetylmuramoyl-pentapeptide-transferase [candidate division BRC1 bacterium ADurb.BinA364]